MNTRTIRDVAHDVQLGLLTPDEAAVILLTLLLPHGEIDHHDPAQHDQIVRARTLLAPFIDTFSNLLHDKSLLPEGKQWTIPLGSSCGFEGRLIVQVDSLGSCNSESEKAP